MPHCFHVRVYYEDTDMAGIVYHANFLKFIERARSDWVRGLGLDQRRMKAEQDAAFVVSRLECDYLAPAFFDDELVVETRVAAARGARLTLEQRVSRGSQTLFASLVTIVVMDGAGRPRRLPADIRHLFGPSG